MKDKNSTTIDKHFSGVNDPRREGYGQRHLLRDIFVIAICAIICGANNWVEIALFGESKKEWFKTFLKLPNGIPSHDIFNRVFSKLNPKEFEARFISWVRGIAEITEGEIIAIDGKTVRRSHDKSDGKAAIHMVSAWANENKMVLGQVKVDDKSNEITAIPKLLNLLDIKGCIVTIDAMGCQRNIAKTILESDADYVLALKGNQGTLQEDILPYFKDAGTKDADYDYCDTIEKDHGRIEVRKCWVSSDTDWLNKKHDWPGLNSIGMIESTRIINNEKSVERRYYISSLEKNSEKFLHAIRSHWGIENSLHWVLDVSFKEDNSRVRKEHGAHNLTILRHIALNMLKKESSKKISINCKRLKAGWDKNYLSKILEVA